MRSRFQAPRCRVRTAPAKAASPCGACAKDCAGCVFAERAAEARAEGDDDAVRRAMEQMARRGCRRLQVSARAKGGLRRRLATGAAAAALVLSLGLAGCETEPGGKADTFGVDTSEVFEVAILPADVVGGDTTPEIWVIMPPPDTEVFEVAILADMSGETGPEVYPVMPPECTTDADCKEQFYGCVDGTCQQTMFPVMPQCQSDTDCAENEVCTNGACEPVVSILPPPCTTNDDCGLHEMCVDGECQPAISILPACVTDQDCQADEVCADGYCQPVVAVLPACVSDDDCNTPIEACVDGQCEQVMWPVMPQCMADDDCAVGEVCVNNTCQLEPTPCASDADCPAGQVCEGECPDESGEVFCVVPQMGTCVPSIEPTTCQSDADCAPGDVCKGGCPEGMFCILPMDSVCKTECSTDADCEANETCLGAETCPPDQVCILPDQKGLCEPAMFAILPPAPLPIAPPPKKASATAWRSYVEGAIAWFRPANDKTGRS